MEQNLGASPHDGPGILLAEKSSLHVTCSSLQGSDETEAGATVWIREQTVSHWNSSAESENSMYLPI